MINYPIKFEPILMDRIWGGNKLMNVFQKKSDLETVGESWELSDVKGASSVVANGSEKGNTLKYLLETYTSDLIGKTLFTKFGPTFPLLIKYIDAAKDLSIQVHPNNELSMKRHQSFGKTEMWYIMQADENAKLVLGFEESLNSDSYLKHLNKNTIASVMHYEPVKQGDSFFIQTGTVHAIGGGIVLAEIQQTSDITYRIYDWDRKNKQGKSRELHTDLALKAINFDTGVDCKRPYTQTLNKSNTIVDCSYFKTSFLPVMGTLELNYDDQDTFVIFMCVKGSGSITVNEFTETLAMGETVLIPAQTDIVTLQGSAPFDLLEVMVP
jgi:mannose-6-phosphate isomerase